MSALGGVLVGLALLLAGVGALTLTCVSVIAVGSSGRWRP